MISDYTSSNKHFECSYPHHTFFYLFTIKTSNLIKILNTFLISASLIKFLLEIKINSLLTGVFC